MKISGEKINFIFYFFIVTLIILVSGCAPPGPKKYITELYDPPYDPQYAYETVDSQGAPSGYTVGILDMNFDFKAVPQGSYVIETDINRQYVKSFVDAYSSEIERIL